MEVFTYRDIDDSDIKIEINFDMLKIIVKATIYNYKGEASSRNKTIGFYVAKNKKKLFNILDNSINNTFMPISTRKTYELFVAKLKKKYLEE